MWKWNPDFHWQKRRQLGWRAGRAGRNYRGVSNQEGVMEPVGGRKEQGERQLL